MNVTVDGKVSLTDLKYVSANEVDGEARWVRQGDVLFNNTNTAELVGKTAYYSLQDPRAYSNHMTRLRFHTEAMDPRFGALALQQCWREGYFEERCNNHVSQASISSNVLLQTPLAFPPLLEQRRIVAQIEALLARTSAARDRLARVPAILRHFRQSVLAAACDGRLTAAWRDAHAGSGTGQKLLDSLLVQRRVKWKGRYQDPEAPLPENLPMLPNCWTWASIESLALKVVDGVHKTPTYLPSGIPFVTVRNLTAGPGISLEHINYISREDHEVLSRRADPELGDLLVTKDGTLGTVRAIRVDQPFSIFVSVALIKPVSTELTDYLELALSSPQVQEQMVGTGSGLQHIVLRDLKADWVPLPPLGEQQEIVRRVAALLAFGDAVQRRVHTVTVRADALAQSILGQAFRGELVPTEAELALQEGRDYEPAADLLERVRQQRLAHPSPKVSRRSAHGRQLSLTLR